MKRIYRSVSLPGVALCCLAILSGCEKPVDTQEPSAQSASEAIKKVETAYYEGAEKIETSGGVKRPETRASQALVDEILKKGNEQLIKFNSRYKSAKILYENYDVGVIPSIMGCPLNDQLVKIYLDNEDNNSQAKKNDGVLNPWNFSWELVGNAKNTILYFCRADGRLFNNSGGKFAVLKLGITKPANVKSVYFLHMDNEDGNGATKFLATSSFTEAQAPAEAVPNYVDGNKNIGLYWYVFDNAGVGAFPTLGFSYGVLGNPANSLAKGEYYTDDEDNQNANAMSTIEGINDMTSRQTGYLTADSWGNKYWVSTGAFNYAATGFKFIEGGNGVQGTHFYLAKVK